MRASNEELGDIAGYQEASARYGLPVQREYVYAVSAQTFEYWRLVRRKREAEVVMVLQRPNGRFLAHTKSFYPLGIYRLLSGGVKPGEDVVAALLREVEEETGLDVRIRRFMAVQRHRFEWNDQALPFASYLFWVQEESGILQNHDSGEQISAYLEVDLPGIETLARKLEALPPDWADWGRFRATAHWLAVEVLSREHDAVSIP